MHHEKKEPTLLWGGRFSSSPDPELWRFTVSREDRRLVEEDLLGSKAQALMLKEIGVLTSEEEKKISQALDLLLKEAQTQGFPFHIKDEDVHSAVERVLVERIGEVGFKIHSGRSRNDQVCLDLRLYLKKKTQENIESLRRFVEILTQKAEETQHLIVPMYTHLQQAQAVSFAHHFLAYAWMFLRDLERFQNAKKRIEICPLGAGAGGGSGLSLRPETVAKALGFERTFENSIDAVSSRDFVSEYGFCLTQSMVHLSRLAEELVLWNTKEFGWVSFDDSLTTGSSMLPHKKNPDMAELVRGKSSGLIGGLTSLLSLQKALPLSYNRDLQEDKNFIFQMEDAFSSSFRALFFLIQSAKFHPPQPLPEICAIDLAEILVRRGIPFRKAHHLVGELILLLMNENRSLDQATVSDLKKVSPEFQKEDLPYLNPIFSVEQRKSPGGGSIESVKIQLQKIKEKLRCEIL